MIDPEPSVAAQIDRFNEALAELGQLPILENQFFREDPERALLPDMRTFVLTKPGAAPLMFAFHSSGFDVYLGPAYELWPTEVANVHHPELGVKAGALHFLESSIRARYTNRDHTFRIEVLSEDGPRPKPLTYSQFGRYDVDSSRRDVTYPPAFPRTPPSR